MSDRGATSPTERRLLPVALAVLVLSGILVFGGAAAAGTEPGDNIVLRLSDLPYGYEIGDDSGCGALGAEDAPDDVGMLVLGRSPKGCWVDFERLYRTTYREPNPNLVVSMALLFDSADGAEEGLAIADQIAEYSFTGITDGALREAFDYSVDVGDAARLFTTDDATASGRSGNQGAVAAWRSGAVLAAVFVGGGSGERAVVDAATLLAARQQQRIEVPTQISPAETDDREVALDSPHLNVDVHWLGRRFDPSGRLPALELTRGYGPLRSGESPGNRVSVEYETGPGEPGVSIGTWRRPVWRSYRRTGLRRAVRSLPCTKKTNVDLRHGHAKIFGGSRNASGARRCPRDASDRFFAHVKIHGATVVTVNIPDGLCCLERTPAGADPYNSFRGMVAIVKRLRVRTPMELSEVG